MSNITLEQEILLKLASRLDNLLTGITKIGVAIAGARAANHWSGALTGLIALELAKSGNLAAGAAGVGVLGVIGLTNIVRVPEAATTTTEGGFVINWPWWSVKP